MFLNTKRRNVVRHQLNVGNETTNNVELNVFFISDIHRRKIDKRLLDKIKTQIDIVVIGGDLAEKGVPHSRISKNVRELSRLGPIFFVWGNNDREAGEKVIREIIARYEGKVLDNENCSIPGHPSWGICGTDDPSSRNVDIYATLRNINNYENVLFVSHTPSVLRKVETLFLPELMLGGHTHGGQIRLGKLGMYERGSFKHNNGHGKLISNGYGTSLVPLRLGALPECHIINIRYTEREQKEL
jgi:predicted MPP superfamily phosphohydrolase